MENQVIITTDLGYGDAGKGTMVDALVHEFDIDFVVRYSGGAQAAHNVVTPDNRHHTFAQFGSGTFRPGTKTYLGPRMLVQPRLLLEEAKSLAENGVADPMNRLLIDSEAPVITPYHQLVNQLKELGRGALRHGSTGIGIGETRVDSENDAFDHLVVGDLTNPKLAREKLETIRGTKRKESLPLLQAHATNEAVIKTWHQFDGEELMLATLESYQSLVQQAAITDKSALSDYLATGRQVLFEGAQGTLLDEDYGFFPYATRGKVRDIHAHELLKAIGYSDQPYVLGITRAYAARHGPGPFPTENAWLRSQLHEQHNGHGTWQGAFRMGHFDGVATRYAIAVNEQVDAVIVTCLDQLEHLERFYYADQYRDAEGRTMSDLTVPPGGDLDALARQTDRLMQGVSPLYRNHEMKLPWIRHTIESLIGLPVVAISEGMTRAEKTFFSAAMQKAA